MIKNYNWKLYHFLKNDKKIYSTEFQLIKACVRYQISIFLPKDSPSKTMKNAFYFFEKTLFVLKIFNFLYFCPSHIFNLSAIALKDDRG